jgi:hypothetical protein
MKIKNITERFIEFAENQEVKPYENIFNTIEICN